MLGYWRVLLLLPVLLALGTVAWLLLFVVLAGWCPP